MDTLRVRVTVEDGETTGNTPVNICGIIKRIDFAEPTLASGTTFNLNIFNGPPATAVEIHNEDTNANSAAGFIEFEKAVTDSDGLHLASWGYCAGAQQHYFQVEQNATQNNSSQDAIYDFTIQYLPT